jgi:hypothetical protein
MTFTISSINKIANHITSSVIPGTGVSKFTDVNTGLYNLDPGQQILYFIILVLLIYITMWLGSMVFNLSIPNIFPTVKKVSTLDFFGLYIVIHLLFC